MDQTERIRQVVDEPALDRDGESIGRVVDVFVDEDTNAPKWVALEIEGRDFFTLAPIGSADLEARPLRLDVDRAHVLGAPTVSSEEKRVSPDEEAEIERHYRAPAGAGTGHGETGFTNVGGDADRGRDTDVGSGVDRTRTDSVVDDERPLSVEYDAPVEVVRSEENLVVDTRVTGAERVRLIKRIVTEQVTQTVEVRHEELVVEREPLARGTEHRPGDSSALGSGESAGATSPATSRRERVTDRLKVRLPSLPALAKSKLGSSGDAFSGETTVLTLMQEEVVISKRIVPRERVRVRKEIVTEQRRISDTVRKEQVEIEEGGLGRSRTEQGVDRVDLDRDAERGTLGDR